MLRGMINFAQHTVRTRGTWGLTPLFFAVFRYMMQEESISTMLGIGSWKEVFWNIKNSRGGYQGVVQIVLMVLGNHK